MSKLLNWDIISSRVEQENIRQDLKFILRFIAVLPKSKKTFNAVSKFTADDKAKVIKYLNSWEMNLPSKNKMLTLQETFSALIIWHIIRKCQNKFSEDTKTAQPFPGEMNGIKLKVQASKYTECFMKYIST